MNENQENGETVAVMDSLDPETGTPGSLTSLKHKSLRPFAL